MTFPVGQTAYPTAVQIRDQILKDLSYYGERAGIVYNVKPGSDYYKLATSLGNRVAIAIANNQLSNEQRNPLLATGQPLRDVARVYGITERPASGSLGPAIVRTSSLGATIPAGWQATATNGKKYRVTTTTVVQDGDTVSIASVETGKATELPAGTRLTWDSAAIATLLNPLTVDADGIAGGSDADDDEAIRTRLVDRLAGQAIGGNTAAIKDWAEDVSSSIQRAFVYQGVRGPSTIDFVVVSRDGDRTVSEPVVIRSTSNVRAQTPGGTLDIVGTTASPEALDVFFAIRLPLPLAAGGQGDGWRDPAPWPEVATRVTGVSGATITVDGTVAPPVGNHVGIWDRNADPPVMREFQILTSGGVSGAWTMTLDGATGFVAAGDVVTPGAFRLVEYAETFYQEMLALGPGEKTDDEDLLLRGARYPEPEQVAPYELTSRQVTTIQAAYEEIVDLEYLSVTETGTLTTRYTPSLPPTTADPPRILTMQNIAFYSA